MKSSIEAAITREFVLKPKKKGKKEKTAVGWTCIQGVCMLTHRKAQVLT